MALSWTGYQRLHRILAAQPLARQEVVHELALRAKLREATSRRYVETAEALGLLVQDTHGYLSLPASGELGQVLCASAWVRLFQNWRQLQAPLPDLRDHLDSFRLLGEERLGVLRAAAALSRRARPSEGATSFPSALLLLEVGRLRSRQRPSGTRWEALEALELYQAILRDTCPGEDLQEAFLRDCQRLHQRQLLRMDVVQYLIDGNQRYASLRTPLGFLRGLWIPEERPGAQPVSEERPRRAQGRRVAG